MTANAANPVALPRTRGPSSMGWRIAVSIISVFGFVAFLLLYFAFWAGSFSALQSVVVVLVAILFFMAANGAAWASWGMRQAEKTTGD